MERCSCRVSPQKASSPKVSKRKVCRPSATIRSALRSIARSKGIRAGGWAGPGPRRSGEGVGGEGRCEKVEAVRMVRTESGRMTRLHRCFFIRPPEEERDRGSNDTSEGAAGPERVDEGASAQDNHHDGEDDGYPPPPRPAQRLEYLLGCRGPSERHPPDGRSLPGGEEYGHLGGGLCQPVGEHGHG